MGKAELYKRYFETFLRATDEKEILRKEVLNLIEWYNPSSVLEIGPGPGDISIPVASRVQRYVAIEQNPQYVQPLQEAGLTVMQGTFPETSVQEQFDMALASHAISYSADIPAFLEAMWLRLNAGGTLAIITYREAESDWTRLMRTLAYNNEDADNRTHFQTISNNLTELSGVPPDVTVVQSHVNGSTPTEVIHALAFVASNGDPEKAEGFIAKSQIIIPILEKQYQTETGYSFPFNHHILTAQKS